ncbi:hypothetical protein FUA48_14880 [Flavobacterium alkalisoli]|uniref:histidine kinase n=1 Tax=Flavobacterium alkalisoli TaxID=2602769 RepID=A0A5B9FV25_9FLAO|nr:histidine kinase dimerization/phosphoacceptor domain -containing protein [Flavobacterium alkalisoli]QEE50815.1 hypothetical protein FUA48_14880 [Flavobacterium alkalisoli]
MKNIFIIILTYMLFVPAIPFAQEQNKLLQLVEKENNKQKKADLLQELSSYYILKPGEEKSDMDSAKVYLQQAEKICREIAYHKGEGNNYLLFAGAYREGGDRVTGKKYAQKAIDCLTKYNEYSLLGEAYMEMACYYDQYEGEMEEKIATTAKGIEAFKRAKNYKRAAEANKVYGEYFFLINKYDRALEELKKSLSLYKKAGAKDLQGIYDIIGQAYVITGNTEEGIKYGLLALKTAEEQGDRSMQLCTINNRLGLTFDSLNENDKALKYFEDALVLAKENNDANAVYFVTNNIASILVLKNKVKEALKLEEDALRNYKATDIGAIVGLNSSIFYTYMYSKEFDKAKKYLDKIMELKVKHDFAEEEIFRINHLASNYYFSVKDFNKTAQLVEENRFLAKKMNVVPSWRIYYIWKYRVDSARGNYKNALIAHQEYKRFDDSISSVNKSEQIAQLQVQYETEKKDQDIKLKQQNIELLTQESDLQKSRAEDARILRNLTFIGIIVLLIILGLLYRNYRNKQKANSKLEEQQIVINDKNHALEHLLNEKEWLLKEIHHRVKNNLQIVMSLLNTQSAYLKDKSALTAIRDSQHRVHSMSLIHQKLYQSEDMTSIPMPAYITDLTEYLKDSFDTSNIHFDLTIEHVDFDVSIAVPLGLILNEAITNSIKYGFPEKEEGVISIKLIQNTEDTFMLYIRDNGVGLPDDYAIKKENSLGLNLIKGLTEDLDGSLNLYNDNGVVIEITFINKTFK